MDIAAIASMIKYTNLRQEAGMSVLKIAMDNAKQQADDLNKIIEQSARIMELSVNPHLGGKIDISL